jgi:hypothetical protein
VATILTAAEASNVLRCADNDPNMLDLLPQVDVYIQTATGRDWAVDTPIYPAAKAAARMLLVRWHEDPGGMAAGLSLGFGLNAILTQLEAKALELATAGVPSEAFALVSTNLSGTRVISSDLVLIFNHVLLPAMTVTLADATGTPVVVTSSVDATGKILTITPDADLVANSQYVLTVVVSDEFGESLEVVERFTT